MRRFQASAQSGFMLPADSGARPAHKRPVIVQARFAESAFELQTLEGAIQVRPGDAVLRGTQDEEWAMPREAFEARYEAVAGGFRARRRAVQALQLDEDFEVLLGDGLSVLRGQPGDWLVDQGDGQLAVVAGRVFTQLYELS